MTKKQTKKHSSMKYDLLVKAQATTTKIIEISNNSIKMESNSKGQAKGKYYSGTHWDTVETTMLADGSATLSIRYMDMTKSGDVVMGTGTGTQEAPSSKGIAKIIAEGTMWTSSPRLSQLNGARWRAEGNYDFAKESVEVKGEFETIS